MSNFKAIAAVSRTLKTLLLDRMETPKPQITIAPPDVRIANMTGERLNLYLFEVAENSYLKNQEIPGHGHASAYGHPPLSLDLHYLLTAYGSNETAEDADLEAQQILGDAMRVLHDHAIITPDLHKEGNPSEPILDASLLGEFERIKITLQPMTLEDFSKIWTALPQANFRRSVAYQVSVVQIESRQPRKAPLPVRERLVYALPFRSPQITEIFRHPPIGGYKAAVAEAGETLRISGVNLAGPATRVTLGDQNISVATPLDNQIDVIVPSMLPAGIHPVQVVHDLMLGLPPTPHRGFRSNVVAFLLIPRIESVNPASAAPGAAITVTVSPSVRRTQEVVFLLGDHVIPAMPLPPASSPSATVQFQLRDIPTGSYLMRIRVDGAESRLTVDPDTKEYTGPKYTVT
jgi:hypothetical protein